MVGTVEYTDYISAEGEDIPDVCPGCDIKQSDGKVLVMELWGMRSTPSLPLLSGPLWPGKVAHDRALTMGWIELTAYLC